MVKIIVELEEKYIEEKSTLNVEKMKVENSRDAFRVMAEVAAFSLLQNKLDGENKEFIVNRNNLSVKEAAMFDSSVMSLVAICATKNEVESQD